MDKQFTAEDLELMHKKVTEISAQVAKGAKEATAKLMKEIEALFEKLKSQDTAMAKEGLNAIGEFEKSGKMDLLLEVTKKLKDKAAETKFTKEDLALMSKKIAEITVQKAKGAKEATDKLMKEIEGLFEKLKSQDNDLAKEGLNAISEFVKNGKVDLLLEIAKKMKDKFK